MPFDTLPAHTTPDLSQPTADALAYVLRHREMWPVGFGPWDYRTCATCAVGLAHRLWGTHELIDVSQRKQERILLGAGMVLNKYHATITPDHIAWLLDGKHKPTLLNRIKWWWSGR